MKHISLLQQDPETIRKIIKIFHPECPELPDDRCRMLFTKGGYNWYKINGKIAGYGNISLGIDNMRDPSMLIGEGHKYKEFELRQKQLRIEVWRFYDDVKINKNIVIDPERPILSGLAHDILIEAGYVTATAKEWIKEYYKN